MVDIREKTKIDKVLMNQVEIKQLLVRLEDKLIINQSKLVIPNPKRRKLEELKGFDFNALNIKVIAYGKDGIAEILEFNEREYYRYDSSEKSDIWYSSKINGEWCNLISFWGEYIVDAEVF